MNIWVALVILAWLWWRLDALEASLLRLEASSAAIEVALYDQ